jgi:hypothetical protein
VAADTDVDDDSSLAKSRLGKPEGEIYMESLVGVSLRLVSKEFPLEVQLHGSKMLQHLVDHRSGQLSCSQLHKLKIQLVGRPRGKEVSVYSAANAGKPKKHTRSLLMLAAKNILKGLVLGEGVAVMNGLRDLVAEEKREAHE